MKNLVIGVVVGALVGALIGYLVWGRQVGTLEGRVSQLEQKLAAAPVAPAAGVSVTTVSKKRAATITISGSGTCTGDVDQPLIGNKPKKRVVFIVDSEDATCTGGNWRIQLRFHNIPATGTTPEIVYNATDNPLNIVRDDIKRVKLADNANVGSFKYEVWVYFPNNPGASYMVYDPELEIEP